MKENSDPASDSSEMPDDSPDSADDGENKLQTQLPGIEVTTQLAGGDIEALEAVHRRQLEWALEHAEEAKTATRL